MYVNKNKRKRRKMRGSVFSSNNKMRAKNNVNKKNKKLNLRIKRSAVANGFSGNKVATHKEAERVKSNVKTSIAFNKPVEGTKNNNKNRNTKNNKVKKEYKKRKGNNYDRLVKPRLKDVEKWSSNQITEKEIARLLGISYSSYNAYKLEYPELQDAVDYGRSEIVSSVKGSLYKSALGFMVTEEYLQTDIEFQDGVEVVVGKRIATKEKYIKPDTSAAVVLLKQYDRESITGHSFTNRDEKEENDKKRDQDIKEKNGTSTGVSDWEEV